MLTPISRYRSYGGALHKDERGRSVIRTVETVGRFRRSYSFNPTLGVSTTRTAAEEYRNVYDWRTTYYDQLKALENELDTNESKIKNIRPIDHSHEIEIKIKDLNHQWDGLRTTLQHRRKLLADARDATEYLSSIEEAEPWTEEEVYRDPKTGTLAIISRRDQENRHQKQVRRITVTITEIIEKVETLVRERQLKRNPSPQPAPIFKPTTVVIPGPPPPIMKPTAVKLPTITPPTPPVQKPTVVVNVPAIRPAPPPPAQPQPQPRPLQLPQVIHSTATSWSTSLIETQLIHKLRHSPGLTNGSVVRKSPEPAHYDSSASSSLLEIWKSSRSPSPNRRTPVITTTTVHKPSTELYGLHGHIDDLLRWIGDRETITEAQELGQTYEHVLALQKNFQDFVGETEYQGTRKVTMANKSCDEAISAGHQDASIVALWKDNLNEAWENLLELMHTWIMLLEANKKLQKFFFDCRETHGQIQEQMRLLPDELGRDAGSFVDLQRKHQTLMVDLKSLEVQIGQLQREGDDLMTSYAGDKAAEIQLRRSEVSNAWRQLQTMCDYRRFDTGQTRDLFTFMQSVKDLSQWIEAAKRKLYASEYVRNITSVESQASNLESMKSDIDLHEEQFASCVSLGRELLAKEHYGNWEIEKKLLKLTTERADLLRNWLNKWEQMRLILKIYKSAKDDPAVDLLPNGYYQQQDSTHGNVDSLIRTINRYKVMDDRTLAERELFNALEKQNINDLKEVYRRQMEDAQKWSTLATHKRPSQEKVETTFAAEHILKLETTLGIEPGVFSERNNNNKNMLHIHENGEQSVWLDGMTDGAGYEGALTRKRTWDTYDRKSFNRKWEKIYCVVRGNRLHFYKDHRHKENRDPLRGGSINLENCTVEVAQNYTKRPHIFSLRTEDGAEFLFQPRDIDDMHRWIKQLQIASSLRTISAKDRSSSHSALQSNSFNHNNNNSHSHSSNLNRNSFFGSRKKL